VGVDRGLIRRKFVRPDPRRRIDDPDDAGGSAQGVADCRDRDNLIGRGRSARLCHRLLGFDLLGRPILEFFHAMHRYDALKAGFDQWGAWIIIIKGLTPIPYKLVTIAAGVTHFDLMTFIGAGCGSFFSPQCCGGLGRWCAALSKSG